MIFSVKNIIQLRELCKCMAFLYAHASPETKEAAAKKYKNLFQ